MRLSAMPALFNAWRSPRVGKHRCHMTLLCGSSLSLICACNTDVLFSGYPVQDKHFPPNATKNRSASHTTYACSLERLNAGFTVSPNTLPVPFHTSAHNRMYTSRHGSRHSLAPSQLLIHSTPIPVHSGLKSILRFSPSIAAPASTAAVSLTAVAMNEACSDVGLPEYLVGFRGEGRGFGNGEERCRGSNQLLCMSKKQ